MENSNPDIVILACSAAKRSAPAPAIDLYTGVMYGTYRANVRSEASPLVFILSARHGLISADKVIEPYDQRLTAERAVEMLSKLDAFMGVKLPSNPRRVMLAGSVMYRDIMRAALNRQLAPNGRMGGTTVVETIGGIGRQRQQLGAFLRGLAPAAEVVGYMANGVPLYRTLGGFTVGQPVTLRYAGRPHLEPVPAIVAELFEMPWGPVANVCLPQSKNPGLAFNWVGLADLRA